MHESSVFLKVFFIALTLAFFYLFYRATNKRRSLAIIVVFLLALQALMSLSGFLMSTDHFPPRFLLVVLPSFSLIILAFLTKSGRKMMDEWDMETFAYLHGLRVLVEVVLLYLFMASLLPKSMTFEGRNFDIFSGITAPFIGYFGWRLRKISRLGLIIWNFVCLLLVLQVFGTGALSIPGKLQVLSFEKPNFAVLLFPYVWLPGVIVPMVILGHFAALKQLLSKKIFYSKRRSFRNRRGGC